MIEYKGYLGDFAFDPELDSFHGTVININDVVTFYGSSVTELRKEMQKSVIDRLVMPQDPSGDALHLAIASFHNVDALLTWNCRHLANANKTHSIRQINQELGLSVPELTTPLNYLGGDD